MKGLLAIASGAALVLVSAPAVARHHGHDARHGHGGHRYGGHRYGERYEHHHGHAYRHYYRHHARYRIGYRFGPRYRYTVYTALPRTYVVRYHLRPRYRYVYTGGYIYVVDPVTWTVIRILNAY
jgi:hypothetical protein